MKLSIFVCIFCLVLHPLFLARASPRPTPEAIQMNPRSRYLKDQPMVRWTLVMLFWSKFLTSYWCFPVVWTSNKPQYLHTVMIWSSWQQVEIIFFLCFFLIVKLTFQWLKLIAKQIVWKFLEVIRSEPHPHTVPSCHLVQSQKFQNTVIICEILHLATAERMIIHHCNCAEIFLNFFYGK